MLGHPLSNLNEGEVEGDIEDVDDETTSVTSNEEKIDANATNAKMDQLTMMMERLMKQQQSQEQLILRIMQGRLNTEETETPQQ